MKVLQHGREPGRAVLPFRPLRVPILIVLLLGSSSARPQGAPDPAQHPDPARPDKSDYHLFRPTPREWMRELSTDRPDQTESAHTVDAGHFQVEIEAVGAVFDRDRSGGGDVRTTGWGTSLNLKAGLLNSVDIQFVLEPYVEVRVEDRVTDAVERASGFGDLQTRLKINLWGNDEGATAMAIMPVVKWPLAKSAVRNGRTEGGVIVLFEYGLPAGWSSTVMTEVDGVSDALGEYDVEFVNSITFGRAIAGRLGGYVEFFTVVGTAAEAPWQGQVDLGFTYALQENLQLDWGCNFGVTKSAPDFNPFLGLSYLF